VPRSRLLILTMPGQHRQRVLDRLVALGVDSTRIEFQGRCPLREYLELYHRLDISLDTFPYNGHTTSLDSLWMGVPVVSLAQTSAVSRGGLSLLSNLGLGELVGQSPD